MAQSPLLTSSITHHVTPRMFSPSTLTIASVRRSAIWVFCSGVKTPSMSRTLMRGMVPLLRFVDGATSPSAGRVTGRVRSGGRREDLGVERGVVDRLGEQAAGGGGGRVAEAGAMQRGADDQLAQAAAGRDPLERLEVGDRIRRALGDRDADQRVEAVRVDPDVGVRDARGALGGVAEPLEAPGTVALGLVQEAAAARCHALPA